MRTAASSIRVAVARCGRLILLLLLAISGCRLGNKEPALKLPAKHSVRSDQLLVYSDFHIPADHRLIQDLKDLRVQVYDHLQLPVQRRQVVVYLFQDEASYRNYLTGIYPNLPHRRAYFFKTAKELAVFTYWGDRVQEDLRHEYTHGLLHASLKSVPLWLDEGLAEYFEVISDSPGAMNSNYPDELVDQIGRGWHPDLQRLEALQEFSAMERIDYQEAWSWVHFMLHGSDDSREALLGYLQDLQTQTQPYPLSKRLKAVATNFEDRYLQYVATLNSLHRAHPGILPVSGPLVPAELPGHASVAAPLPANSRVEYTLRVPSHLQGQVTLTGANGTQSVGDGAQIYAQAHRHGWDDFLRAVEQNTIDLQDASAVQRFAEDPGTEFWLLARQARTQGVWDCFAALRGQPKLIPAGAAAPLDGSGFHR